MLFSGIPEVFDGTGSVGRHHVTYFCVVLKAGFLRITNLDGLLFIWTDYTHLKQYANNATYKSGDKNKNIKKP